MTPKRSAAGQRAEEVVARALTAIADLVTEMTSIKHPCQAGFEPQRGAEF